MTYPLTLLRLVWSILLLSYFRMASCCLAVDGVALVGAALVDMEHNRVVVDKALVEDIQAVADMLASLVEDKQSAVASSVQHKVAVQVG